MTPVPEESFLKRAARSVFNRGRRLFNRQTPEVQPVQASTPEEKSRRELIEEATKDRRHPLRGRALVDLARAIGLDWAPTGTGHKPGTLLASRSGIRLPARLTCRKRATETGDRCRYCNNDLTAKIDRTRQKPLTNIRHLVMETGSLVRVE